MAQLLELAHLVEQHGVTEVQVRRSGIEAGLDPQRAAKFQPRFQLVALEDFIAAAGNLIQDGLQIGGGLWGHGQFSPAASAAPHSCLGLAALTTR